MALFTPILGNISGKVAGNVFSRNRGGSYVRLGTNVVNPNTPAQQQVRAIMGDLAVAWSEDLTAADRTAWDLYAAAVPMVNRIGATIFLTGQNHFVRSNVPRLQSGLARVDTGPEGGNLGEAGIITVASVIQVPQAVSVTFDTAQDWVGETGSVAIIQTSRPQAITITSFKGPFRLAGLIEGDDTTPPTSPETVEMPFPVAVGQRVFVRARVSREDGRLSHAQISSVVAAA